LDSCTIERPISITQRKECIKLQNQQPKRYYSLKQFLNEKFGENVYKVSIDAGFSCPNRDGTAGKEGCIFCSPRGSGDFAGDSTLSVREQLYNSHKGIKELSEKYGINKYIAYFQAYTNTYAPLEELRQKYLEAISVPGVVGIAIATRPDCMGADVLKLLKDLNRQTYVWVELGLQTIHENTAILIGRGYPLSCFEETVSNLNKIGINTVCHIILGLPGESKIEMLESIKYVSSISLQGIKLHLLHVLKGTPLEKMYKDGKLQTLSIDEYVELVVDSLEMLPPNFVIHRLTGDGPKDSLIEPQWSKNKREVLNCIERTLVLKNTYQGRLYNDVRGIIL